MLKAAAPRGFRSTRPGVSSKPGTASTRAAPKIPVREIVMPEDLAVRLERMLGLLIQANEERILDLREHVTEDKCITCRDEVLARTVEIDRDNFLLKLMSSAGVGTATVNPAEFAQLIAVRTQSTPEKMTVEQMRVAAFCAEAQGLGEIFLDWVVDKRPEFIKAIAHQRDTHKDFEEIVQTPYVVADFEGMAEGDDDGEGSDGDDDPTSRTIQ